MDRVKLDYETPSIRQSWRPWRVLLHPRLVTGSLLVVLLVLSALFFPGVYYRHTAEVDIRAGRIRTTDYILLIRVSQRIEDSPLSRALNAQTADQPEWRMVIEFEGTSRVSPHYSFHGAIAQMRQIEMIWQLAPFTAEAKEQMALTVLALWKAADHDGGAMRYISEVADRSCELEQSDLPVRADHLPRPTGSTRPAGQP